MLLNRPRTHRIMKENNIDALIATSLSNVAYISDYLCLSHRMNPGIGIYGILSGDSSLETVLVIPSLEVDAWAEQPGSVGHIEVYGTFYRYLGRNAQLTPDDQRIYEHTIINETLPDALSTLIHALEKLGLRGARLGLDESALAPATWIKIVELLPKAQIVPASSLFQKIRMVKTEAEIDRLKKSAKITEKAMQRVLEEVHPGITEDELANIFKASVCENGGEPQFWLVNAGRRSAHVHSRQTAYQIQEGDIVKLDVGCTYQFYWSDVGRTKVLGNPTDEQLHIHDCLNSGLNAMIGLVKPGVRASEVFDTAVNTIRESGIVEFQRHHCGHGIGLDVYGAPIIQPCAYKDIFGFGGADPILEEGMVINLEVPYCVLGYYGFIIEDTCVVRKDGIELLTHLDKSLFIS